jgi:hypothetical protein
MLDVRDEALVVMQRSAEGSEGASEAELEEEEGRGAPFYVRRRHESSQELWRAAVDVRKSGSRETSLEITCASCLGAPARAWRLAVAPEAGAAVGGRYAGTGAEAGENAP